MKKSFMLAVAVLFAFAGTALAQNSASAGANATARVVRPILVTNCGNLSFGNIIGSAAGGTVTVSNNVGGSGPASYSDPSNMQPGSQTGTISNACFCVTGENGFTYTETHPSNVTVTNTATCTGTGCSNTMTVDLSSAAWTGGAAVIGTDDNDWGDPSEASENETNCFHIGGTLHVGTTNNTHIQNLGTYSGTWSEQVQYN